MDVNLAHWHLLLNHFPIIGSIIGLGLFLASFVGENKDLRRASFIVFTGIAFLSIGTFLTGFGAQAMVTGKPGISDALDPKARRLGHADDLVCRDHRRPVGRRTLAVSPPEAHPRTGP